MDAAAGVGRHGRRTGSTRGRPCDARAREFVEPSVEYVFQAENVEQEAEDDLDAGEGGLGTIARDLAASLARSPIEPDEVRRALAAAGRAGLDWREVYERAVRSELVARPYQAPAIPPAWRVAPGGRGLALGLDDDAGGSPS